MLIQFLFAFILFFSHFNLISWNVFLYASLWGSSYALLTLLQMHALHYVETNTLFPITSVSALTVSVIAGYFLFGDILSYLQILGILLVILTVFLFVYKSSKIKWSKYVLLFGLGIIFFSTFNKIIQKFGVDTGDIYNLQIYQYFIGLLLVGILMFIFERKKYNLEKFKLSIKSGFLIGSFAFFGGFALLIALSKGPFSLITSIHSLYILITAIIAFFMFNEELTLKKILLICLAIIAVLLMRLG